MNTHAVPEEERMKGMTCETTAESMSEHQALKKTSNKAKGAKQYLKKFSGKVGSKKA